MIAPRNIIERKLFETRRRSIKWKHNLQEACIPIRIDRLRLKADRSRNGVSVIFQHESKGWPISGGKTGRQRCSSACCDSATRARDNYRWRAAENVRQNQLTVVARCHRSAWTAERSIIYRVSRSRN